MQPTQIVGSDQPGRQASFRRPSCEEAGGHSPQPTASGYLALGRFLETSMATAQASAVAGYLDLPTAPPQVLQVTVSEEKKLNTADNLPIGTAVHHESTTRQSGRDTDVCMQQGSCLQELGGKGRSPIAVQPTSTQESNLKEKHTSWLHNSMVPEKRNKGTNSKNYLTSLMVEELPHGIHGRQLKTGVTFKQRKVLRPLHPAAGRVNAKFTDVTQSETAE